MDAPPTMVGTLLGSKLYLMTPKEELMWWDEERLEKELIGIDEVHKRHITEFIKDKGSKARIARGKNIGYIILNSNGEKWDDELRCLDDEEFEKLAMCFITCLRYIMRNGKLEDCYSCP